MVPYYSRINCTYVSVEHEPTSTGSTPIPTFGRDRVYLDPNNIMSGFKLNVNKVEEPLQHRDPGIEAKRKKISVPKLIKSNIGNKQGYKERKEYWR